MFGSYLVSLIRTVVPVGVGAALTWLALRTGVVLGEETSAALAVGATGVAVAAYYAIVRALESRWPVFGKLLGRAVEPTYIPPAEPYVPTVVR